MESPRGVLGKSPGSPREVLGRLSGSFGRVVGKSSGNHREVVGKSSGIFIVVEKTEDRKRKVNNKNFIRFSNRFNELFINNILYIFYKMCKELHK